eukprot:NODE_231_length_13709_cov_0.444526.p9 type:complete len:123 gc:universal NODE_231_length_13709_cov_0.444526:1537-1169(-)
MQLIRLRHILIKHLLTYINKCWMSNPGTIVTSQNFSNLVIFNFHQRGFICLDIIFNRNLSGHSTHGMYASLMTSFNQQFNVGFHKWNAHCDILTIRKNKFLLISKVLYNTEYVIPSTTVQSA